MDRVILIILALISAGAGISYLLASFFSRKWVWYIPSMVGVCIIAFLTYKIETVDMEGFEELGYVIMSLFAFVFILGNLMTNVLITLRRRNKRGE